MNIRAVNGERDTYFGLLNWVYEVGRGTPKTPGRDYSAPHVHVHNLLSFLGRLTSNPRVSESIARPYSLINIMKCTPHLPDDELWT